MVQASDPSPAERDLQRGVDRGEFVLVYQPVVDLRRDVVAGAEALLRWDHPTRGLLWPSDFLPDVQHEALRVRINRWVIQTAVAQAAHWKLRYPDQTMTIAVNSSCHDLDDDDLEVVTDHLQRAGVAPSAITLEVGEAELFDHVEQNRRRLLAARALGLQVVLDDFGSATVVASPSADAGSIDASGQFRTDRRDDTLVLLESLEGFPIDAIKLDRNLLEGVSGDPAEPSLLAGVIRLARRLGFRTIAEGVQTQDEARMLQVLGCDLAQGYYFHRPQTPDYIEVLMRERQRASRTPLSRTAVSSTGSLPPR